MQPSSENSGSPARHFRKWALLLIAIGTCLFSWPSVVNKGPFFISDTSAYLRSADAAFSTQLSYTSIWSDKRHLYDKTSTQEQDGELGQADRSVAAIHPPLMGRSIYYGAFLYFPVIVAGEHAAVFVQAAVAAVLVWIAVFPFFQGGLRRRAATYLGICAMLAALTPLPFTASLIVPDYLTGAACASLILLLCLWNAYSWFQRSILIGVVFLGALSHSSNLPLLLLLALIATVMRLLGNRLEFRAVLVAFSAVALGFAGDATFSAAVEYKTGIAPIRPPFLTARLIADGPGHKLLRDTCPNAALEVCRYAARTPYDSDLFLWSNGERDGVFSVVDHASQRKLSEQDAAFAIATLKDYPLLTLASTMGAATRQLTLFNYDIWRGRTDKAGTFPLQNLPPPVADRMARTLNVQGIMPVQPFQRLGAAFAFISLLGSLFCFWESRRSDSPKLRALGLALLLVIIALLANAMIAGGLSKPDARYNLRAIWILPLFLGLYLLARRDRAMLKTEIMRSPEPAIAPEQVSYPVLHP